MLPMVRATSSRHRQAGAHNETMEDDDQNLELGPLFMRWASDSVRARGLGKSLAYLAAQAWSLLRDSMPERSRSRFGDIDYDCDYGFDTTWARLSWSVRLREVFDRAPLSANGSG